MAENFRPEDMPREFGLTVREQHGLLLETTRNRDPPCSFYQAPWRSFYKVLQLIYVYQGIFSSYFHIELCDTAHQSCAYRHSPSDRFLRMTSMCCECFFCPMFIIEHYHRPSKPCTHKCDIRPVHRPRKLPITLRNHSCAAHIDNFPPYFVRRILLNYPAMPFSPFFSTEDDYRISANIMENGLKGIEDLVAEQEEETKDDFEVDVNISSLFL